MFRILAAVIMLVCTAEAQIEPSSPAPAQTARQALLEMFLAKNADAFQKHLPESFRQVFTRKGDTVTSSLMMRFAMIGSELTAGGNKLETFDNGPILATIEDRDGQHKVEILVESDSLQGEEDAIQLSFRAYQDGQLQGLPIVPLLIFSMKQEKDVWRLNELSGEARIPLSDPEYISGLRKEQNKMYERMAPLQLQTMVSAELSYSRQQPAKGYTCKLSDILERPIEPGYNLPPAGFDGTKDGYVFSVKGCTGSPATKFQVSAVPQDADSGMMAFCADESVIVRSSTDGQADTCFNSGEPWKQH